MTRNENSSTGGESNRPSDEQAKQVAVRLNGRRQAGETRADVIERLLDETVEDVPLPTVINEIFSQFDHVASIDVGHPNPESPTMLTITVYTGDADGYEDTVDIYRSGRYRAVIENESGERFTPSFDIIATVTGPSGMNTAGRTCVYMAEQVIGAEPQSVDDGLATLQQKLGKSSDEVEAMVTDGIQERGARMEEEVREKREEVLGDVEQLLTEAEEVAGSEFQYIWRNIYGARDALLDDGEYNHDVRFALHQIRLAVESVEEEASNELTTRCNELEGALKQRAVLPPKDEVER